MTTILAGNPLREICGLTALHKNVCVFVCLSVCTFSKLLQAIPKSDLSTYVLCLMMYLMSYDLYHMSYLMSYIIWSHGFGLCLVFRTYDLMTRVDALYLPSTGHLLRILIPLEEPPHLTADKGEISFSQSTNKKFQTKKYIKKCHKKRKKRAKKNGTTTKHPQMVASK